MLTASSPMEDGQSRTQAFELANAKQDLSKQLAASSNAGGGIVEQLTANPFFTAVRNAFILITACAD